MKIEERAPAKLGIKEPRFGVPWEPLAVVSHDSHDIAQASLGDQSSDLCHVGKEPSPHCFHQEQTLGSGGVY